ncbi:MAG: EF-P lysine aminoacylase GenX [Alphaproteobacteria bacterium]|nr:EF-P lysine aminoacylase GenX [Alphaproteobacteria bacterium]
MAEDRHPRRVVRRARQEVNADGLRARAVVLRALRRWFDDHGYLEVPTPTLVRSAGMEEHLHPLPCADGFLRTSPEFALKRVAAAGLPRIYEIGPCFRDREQGTWHGREFTMLEWYRAGAELVDLMAEVEGLVTAAAGALGVRVPGPFRRTTILELFAADGVDLRTASPRDIAAEDGWDDAFFRRWVERIEPGLTGALFVEGWPASQAALSVVRDDGDWPVAQRFEVFVDGVELANAFLELLDADEQRQRFHEANALRAVAGEAPNPVDEAFVQAVGRMPATAGIALGVDRLVAVLTGSAGIDAGRVPW